MFPKIVGFAPKSSNFNRGFCIIFTIHFGVYTLFLETPTSCLEVSMLFFDWNLNTAAKPPEELQAVALEAAELEAQLEAAAACELAALEAWKRGKGRPKYGNCYLLVGWVWFGLFVGWV